MTAPNDDDTDDLLREMVCEALADPRPGRDAKAVFDDLEELHKKRLLQLDAGETKTVTV